MSNNVSDYRFPIWKRMYSAIIGTQAKFNLGAGPERLYRVHTDDNGRVEFNGPDYDAMTDNQLATGVDYLPHDCFWIEEQRQGYLIWRNKNGLFEYLNCIPQNTRGILVTKWACLGDASHNEILKKKKAGDKFTKMFSFADSRAIITITRGGMECTDNVKTQITAFRNDLMNIAALLGSLSETARLEDIAEKCALSVDRPIYAPYRGDIEVVRREWRAAMEMNTASPERRIEILARKRDHAVRGHWRTYANGRKVWIEPHRRGDISLGTVTSHLEIRS